MENIAEVNKNLVEDCGELREKNNELMTFISNLRVQSQNQQGSVDRLLGRMEKAEARVREAEKRVDGL